MLFALYVNAFAKSDSVDFLTAFKNIERLNAEFENPESKKFDYDIYMQNNEVKTKFLNIIEGKKKGIAFLLVNSRVEISGLSEPLQVILLFDLEMFENFKKKVYAFLNFKTSSEYNFPEAIVFFNDDKVDDHQNIEVFYTNYQQNQVSFKQLRWKPDARLSDLSARNIFSKFNRMSLKLNYYKARWMIANKKAKVFDKSKAKQFEEQLTRRKLKKKINDLFDEFKVYLPKDNIDIQNYHAMFGKLKAPKLYSWTPPPSLSVTAYRVIKRRLFLYKMVGPFREVCGLPKRKKIKGKVEIYTKDLPEGIPLDTIDKLNQYASPSQVLHQIAKHAENSMGDVEEILKFIRGLYRASRKISLMLDSQQYDLIEKVVSRYFK